MLAILPLVLMAWATLPVPCNPFSFRPSNRAPARNIIHSLEGSRSSISPSGPLFVSTKSSHDDADNVQLAIDKFISTLQKSLDDGSFESFALKGPSAPRKRRGNKARDDDADADAASLERQKEKLRGKYKTIGGRLVLLREKGKRRRSRGAPGEVPPDEGGDGAGGLHVQATIKYHLATDLAQNWRVDGPAPNSDRTEAEEGLRRIFSTAAGDDVDGRGGAPLSEWGARNMANGEPGILAGELATSDAVYKLRLRPRREASFEISERKSRDDGDEPRKTDDSSRLSHDRPKNVPLSPRSEFFRRLGVTGADGKPANGMASKLRQCQKYVEVVGNLVDDARRELPSTSPARIRTIDMGCGRGYLTFSLHSHLSGRFGGASVETRGVDRRPKLVEEIDGVARDLGGEFATLGFVEGTIDETRDDPFGDDAVDDVDAVDVVIALHACDRATDDAISFAVDRGADVVVLAPCCQHELRPQIDRHARANPDHPLGEVLRHAIYRERAAETATDAVRAILLEIAGYEVRVFEFVGGEHTAKNVMIAATRAKGRRSVGGREEHVRERRRRLIDLAQLYGIKKQRLATLMGESLVPGGGGESKGATRNPSGMAPL